MKVKADLNIKNENILKDDDGKSYQIISDIFEEKIEEKENLYLGKDGKLYSSIEEMKENEKENQGTK